MVNLACAVAKATTLHTLGECQPSRGITDGCTSESLDTNQSSFWGGVTGGDNLQY